MRGAVKIFNEIRQRKLNIAVVGIPKTVDNDIGIIDRSFGFQTAVEMAQQAISAAHVEAESAVNGKGGLFEFLDQRLKENEHVVLVVVEGAGQDIIPRTYSQKEERDESGNLVFLDVGVWLKSELKKWWDREHPGELFTVKYIDPTYMIRAVHANVTDNLYCTLLAHSAIHGVMGGYTGFVAGPINGNYAYIPREDVACANNPVNTKDHNWSWDYEDILLPTDEQWPFLLRFPIGCFGICLGLSSQAVLWHNLATSPATRFLHITPNISFLIWLLALAVLIAVSITYILKCIFYFHSTLFST
ncbi:phosphofructokinase beta-subunit [Lathyrus oleraceus]|uniref:Phosphofructokinase beta-subunit n=1 Tax=Pisum sativum TaxID=3888 RepID=A0A9D5BGU3_PEA|nr:phosphofructokinase beta-subunit [Pisum sativum]